MRHRLFAVVVIAAVALFGIPVTAVGQAPIRLVVNEIEVSTDVPPLIESGRTLVPIRVVSENLGATVGWDGPAQRVSISWPGTEVTLVIGQPRAVVNGAELPLDVPPRIVDGRTMVPLRFVAEALGANVNWEAQTRTVSVQSFRVTEISWERAQGRGRLAVSVPAAVNYTISSAEETDGRSPRLILDLHGAVLAGPLPQIIVAEGNVMQVRTGMVSASVSRVVIDLTEPVRYRVVRDPGENKLYVEIGYKVMRSSYERRPEGQAVIIHTTGPVTWDTMLLSRPDRLVVDIHDTTLSKETVTNFSVKNPIIDGVRIGQFQVDPDIVRVVIDLRRPVSYHVQAAPAGLEVFVYSEVTGLVVSDAPGETYVDIMTSMPTGHAISLLSDPLRLRVEVPFANLADGVSGITAGRPPVSEVSVETVTDDEDRDVVRVEVSLDNYLGHELRVTDKGLRLALIRSVAHGRTIVIDPGHGGTDPGAIGPSGVYEKDINLAMSLMLRDLLIASGAQVMMTRDRDTSVDLYSRPQMANLLNADLLLSVHCNSFGVSSKTGFEVYHWTNHPSSAELARDVHRHMLDLGVPDRGVKSERFVVLREARIPAALVEVAFLSNPGEEKMLQDPAFQYRVAQALAAAIGDFLGR